MNAIPIQLPSGSYLLVKVPEDAENIGIGAPQKSERLWFDLPDSPNHPIDLPEGHWHLLGEVAEIGEETAKSIVDIVEDFGNRILYRDYLSPGLAVGFRYAVASLRSLLAANNVEGRCVILKQQL